MSIQNLPGDSPPVVPALPLPVGPTEAGSADGREQRLLRSFVGSNVDFYLKKWGSPAVKPSERTTGFNWAALFFSGLWLAYRKMYKAVAIFLAVVLVETIAEEVLFVGILGHAETPAALGRFVGIAFGIICGACGNLWYLRHANAAVADVLAQGLDEPAAAAALSKRGGTSLLASLGFLLLLMVGLTVVYVGSELLFHPADGLTTP